MTTRVHLSHMSVIKNLAWDHLSFTAGDEKYMNLLFELCLDPTSTSIPSVTQQDTDTQFICFKYENFNLLT